MRAASPTTAFYPLSSSLTASAPAVQWGPALPRAAVEARHAARAIHRGGGTRMVVVHVVELVARCCSCATVLCVCIREARSPVAAAAEQGLPPHEDAAPAGVRAADVHLPTQRRCVWARCLSVWSLSRGWPGESHACGAYYVPLPCCRSRLAARACSASLLFATPQLLCKVLPGAFPPIPGLATPTLPYLTDWLLLRSQPG